MRHPSVQFRILIVAIAATAILLTDLLPARAFWAARPAPPVASSIEEAQFFWPFGRRQARPRYRERRPRWQARRTPQRQQRRQAPAARRAAPAEPAGPKSTSFTSTPATENTTRVVVFGDSMAGGLADGLAGAFTAEKGFQVQHMTKASSGLVRTDFYDWNSEMAAATATERVDIAIFMIGINDRQAIRADGSSYQPKTPRWTEIYQSRIDGLVKLMQDRGAAVYWVGLPIMRSKRFSQDMQELNGLFRQRVELRGARFIDVWDSFADENGAYTTDGPDLSGTRRKMRRSNGIHLTSRGNKKLAHFVEQALQPDLQVAGLGADGRRIIRQGASGGLAVVGGAGAAGGEELAGGAGSEDAAAQGIGGPAVALSTLGSGAKSDGEAVVSPLFKVLMRGEALEPKTGRADDFAWPRDD